MTGVTLLGELATHSVYAAQLPRKAKSDLEKNLRLGFKEGMEQEGADCHV